MESCELEILWNQIHYEPPSQYVYKRIDPLCQPELNIGINSNLNRCLILELPKVHSVDFQSSNTENLALYFFRDTNCIVLELLDSAFNDLFNDLILSLYHSIMDLKEVSEYTSIFIKIFHKWTEFFNAKKYERLSDETIKGLFGELYVLKSLVLDSKSSKINDTLRSWQGPYDKGHDFILDQKNIEVKTKNFANVKVRISSEYQLEQELGKRLELVVISVDNDSVKGLSLSNLIECIRIAVIKSLGDITILLEALNQKSLSFKNMHEYDTHRYLLIKKDTYDPTLDGFPKIIKSNLPDSINEVKYSLNLTLLDDFLIQAGDR